MEREIIIFFLEIMRCEREIVEENFEKRKNKWEAIKKTWEEKIVEEKKTCEENLGK